MGVLARHSSLRAEVVPKKRDEPPAQLPLFPERDEPAESAKSSAKSAGKRTAEPTRHPWSYLLKRVFAVDILACQRCGGRLRIVEVASKPDDASRVLGGLGWSRGPPCAASRRVAAAGVRVRAAAPGVRLRSARRNSVLAAPAAVRETCV